MSDDQFMITQAIDQIVRDHRDSYGHLKLRSASITAERGDDLVGLYQETGRKFAVRVFSGLRRQITYESTKLTAPPAAVLFALIAHLDHTYVIEAARLNVTELEDIKCPSTKDLAVVLAARGDEYFPLGGVYEIFREVKTPASV